MLVSDGMPDPEVVAQRPHNRYRELDGIRGVAALTVFLGHVLLAASLIGTASGEGWTAASLWPLRYPPFAALTAGTEAVLLFFMLSGFVLALPYVDRPSAPGYRAFLIKRVFRLYPASVLVVLAAVFARLLLQHLTPTGVTHLFTREEDWAGPVTLHSTVAHLLLVPGIDVHNLDGPLWSLVFEMRVSLFFPVLVWLIARRSAKTALAIVAATFLMAAIPNFRSDFHLPPTLPVRLLSDLQYTASMTVRYAALFLAGILLAQHRSRISTWYSRRSALTVGAIVALGLSCYTYPFIPSVPHGYYTLPYLDIILPSIGCAIFITSALSISSLRHVLMTPLCQFLGRISYSLYLVHMLILLSILRIFTAVPVGYRVILAAMVSFAIADLMQRTVEAPFIRWGHSVAARFRQHHVFGSRPSETRAATEVEV